MYSLSGHQRCRWVWFYIWPIWRNVAFYNNNNLLHLYSAFLGTQSALHRGGGFLNHHQCAASTWMMRRQPYCARTRLTHQLTGGEETVMKPISVWGWLGGHDGQRPLGKFGHLIFNYHRESGPLFNISSEGRCFWQYSVTVLGLWDPHRPSTPCWHLFQK